jgi:NAD(P)-dependent dehydrogenase (short-subunit alcohol dehydrogenase family)
MTLAGKIAIVTGSGGTGCGRAIARRFAREGARVVVSDINPAGGEETLRMISAETGQAAFFHADLSAADGMRELIAFARKTFGGVDVLVNNASAPYHPETPFGHWMETIQVDLVAPMSGVLACLDSMRERGGGAIVNIASVSALGHGRKHAEVPAYDVAKSGLIRLTTTLGILGQRDNIRVNCLAPGWIAVPEVQAYVDSLDSDQRARRGVPKTLISTGEIADAVVQLATDETLAGRVMVWWNDEPRGFIPVGDPGYERLKPGDLTHRSA